ncbi:MAG: hypothetical protein HOQ45_17535 [Nocardioidaceae bacterium]|nr:hypothetical protein [Nocardioidaceae bacterium]
MAGRRDAVVLLLRRVAAAGCAAAVAGVLVGALGGRLAMHALAVANPDATGARSDDGFVIGQVTAGGTLQLVAASLQLTLLGATVYLLVRPVLLGTGVRRVLLSALGFGVTAAAVLIDPDGFDFTGLDPPWLPMLLFVLLPVGLVVVFAALAERWLADGSWFLTAPAVRVLPLLVLWVAAGAALLLAVPVLLVAVAVAAAGGLPHAVTRFRWVGRLALVTVAALAALDLVSDAARLLA